MTAHQRDEQHVLQHLALCVAAADPGEIGRHRFEDLRAARVIAVGEGHRRAADGGHDRTRADQPLGHHGVERRKAAVERGAVRRRFEDQHMRIDERMAGRGKGPPCMVRHILPQAIGHDVIIGLQPPEQRCGIADDIDRRSVRDAVPYLVGIDGDRRAGIAALQRRQRRVPGDMPV